jgi:phage terminase small subunit
MSKLTEKQKRFCEEYLIDLNATQAYIRAGYKATNNKVAEANARKLLAKYSVSEYIKELREKQSERTEITADEVIKELKTVAFADTKLQGKDKVRALELLGQHLGMFTEKVSVTTENKLPELLEALKE